MEMVNVMKKWYERNFKVISLERASELQLTFVRNVYGDEINHINCRSIWKDEKGRTYRVDSLNRNSKEFQNYNTI